MLVNSLQTGIALALLAAAGPGAGQPQAQVHWDLPSAYAAGNFHTENLQQFAAEVLKATDGRLRITVHPDATLFKANEIKRAVQGGQAQLGEVLLVNAENEHPLFGVDGIPMLATSYAQSRKLSAAQKPLIQKLLQAQGLQLLYTVAWPPQGIFVKKEIGSVADMRGIRWRAYSPATAAIAELIGAQPVTIQAAELHQALATGVVESYMSSSATGYDTRSYESVKYFYDTQAWLPKNALIVNHRAFEALDKASQDALLQAATTAEARGWKLSEEKNEGYRKALAEKGMRIMPPSPKLMQDLQQMGGILLANWEKKAGAEGQALLKAYRQR